VRFCHGEDLRFEDFLDFIIKKDKKVCEVRQIYFVSLKK
jgi:hypothetical protein